MDHSSPEYGLWGVVIFMYNYDLIKEKFGKKVSQTIDSPIMVFDYFELGDVFAALGVVLIFGVIFYSWGIMFFLLFFVLVLGPIIKRRSEKGVFFHWPYKKLNMSLPGLINPGENKKYSD